MDDPDPLLRREKDGGLVLEHLPPLLVVALHEVPALLDGQQPERVSQRLYPLPCDDEDAREEWRRLVHPDLFALVASAREVVAKDLSAIAPPGRRRRGWRLSIPARHVAGWIAALNAARLTLAELHGVGEGDMGHDGLVVHDARSEAVAKIHLLGWMQQLLIEGAAEK